jgi:hypothetical protein
MLGKNTLRKDKMATSFLHMMVFCFWHKNKMPHRKCRIATRHMVIDYWGMLRRQ